MKQAGRIVFDGLESTRFWLRALNLEKELAQAQALIGAKAARKWAAVPIISTYKVDENLSFLFVICAEVDSLGLRGGGGCIYYCSPDRLEEVMKTRDKLADDLLKDAKEKFDEVIPIEEKGERGRAD